MSERIRKLAKKWNRSIDDVVAALASIGESRYRQAEDLVPDAVLGPLERALKKLPASRAPAAKSVGQPAGARFPEMLDREGRPEPMPTRIPDDPGLNATLQDYLAAAPLGELKKSLIDKKQSESRQPVTQPPPSTEAMLRDSLGAEIHRRRLAEDALAALRHELTRLQAERSSTLDETRAALDQARSELVQARADAARQLTAAELRITTLLTELTTERQVAEGHLLRASALQLEVDHFKQQLEQLHSELQAELARRLALEARLEARLDSASPAGGSLAARPEPVSPTTTSPLFPSAPSALPEQKSASNRDSAARRLVSACRERGITRINVVGGSPKYQQELKSLLPGIELRGIDGTSFMDQSRARQQVAGADLTIVWGGSILTHRVSSCYTDLKDPSVIVVHHRGMEGLLRDAAEFIRSEHFVRRD